MTTGIFTPPADGTIGFVEEIKQLTDTLTGQRDAGAITLVQPLATPAAPTANTIISGAITGTGYQWGVYWISGIQYKDQTATLQQNIVGRTPYGALTSPVSVTSKLANVSISLLTPPPGTIGWGVVRNKSAGGSWFIVPGSEQFLSSGGSLAAQFTDNVPDASLGSTPGPVTNTTGTSIVGVPYVIGRTTGGIYTRTATTTESSLISGATASATTGFPITGGQMGANSVVRFAMRGDMQNPSSTIRQITIKVKFGGTTFWGQQFNNTADTDSGNFPFSLDFHLANLGATNSNFAHGEILAETGTTGGTGSVAGIMNTQAGNLTGYAKFASAVQTIDTTLPQYLDVTVTYDGSGTAQIRRMFAIAELL